MEQKPRKHEICIPEHAKPKKNNFNEEAVAFPSSFLVEGIYEIKGELTITGKIVKGALTNNSKLVYKGNLIPVKEVLLHGRVVSELTNNQKGAFTIEPDMLVILKSNETLKFE